MITAGFERVEEVFQQHASEQDGGGLAFAATVDGEPVVDLVGGEIRPGEAWGHATRGVVMSVSKGWSVMCLQVLVDRGRLTLDTPIVEVWPEFGANGKEATRVRHLLDHSAGAIGLGDVASIVQWDGGGWADLDAIATRLAETAPAWAPGTRSGYHAVTFGWLVGELVRRIDGRTLGRFFHEELAAPLGLRAAIGVPIGEQGDIAPVISGAAMIDIPLLRKVLAQVPVRMRDPSTLLGQAFLGDGARSIMDAVDDLMVDGRFLAAEVPSSNGVSSAADLARLYSVLACGGALGDLRLFSLASVELFLRPGPPLVDSVMGSLAEGPVLGRIVRRLATVSRSVGGYEGNAKKAGKRAYGPEPSTIGSGGAGGQFAFADPTNRISGGFVRSKLSPSSKTQEALVKALYECIGKRPGAAR